MIDKQTPNPAFNYEENHFLEVNKKIVNSLWDSSILISVFGKRNPEKMNDIIDIYQINADKKAGEEIKPFIKEKAGIAHVASPTNINKKQNVNPEVFKKLESVNLNAILTTKFPEQEQPWSEELLDEFEADQQSQHQSNAEPKEGKQSSSSCITF